MPEFYIIRAAYDISPTDKRDSFNTAVEHAQQLANASPGTTFIVLKPEAYITAADCTKAGSTSHGIE